ncbi:MAG: histidinol-phosphate transaminase, partial [Candidatus Omnitrophica bacterium]|nr:histidinol-phosphate transaminase [Candidatus Omnitrophota bacterium]
MTKTVENLAKKSLSLIQPYVPGKPIELLFKEKGIPRIIKLASNENPLGASPLALKAIKKKISKINRYPEGSASALREKLASFLNVNSSQIIVGSGSSEIISMAIQAFCEPEDEIIFPEPSFIIYRILAHAFGLSPTAVNLNDDFSYNIESFVNKISKRTKMVILCNPNNPTGSHITKNQLKRLMNNIPDSVIILSDEAYFEYVEDPEFGTAMDWLGKKNVIVTRTFSKIYGLAGLRIGYGIASKEIIRIMEKIRPPFNTTSLAQEAALAAIEDKEFVTKSILNNKIGKDYLTKGLENLGFRVFPTQANFIFCDSMYDVDRLNRKLEENGIIIRPMTGFRIKGNFMRITIGKPSENRLLIKTIKKIVDR